MNLKKRLREHVLYSKKLEFYDNNRASMKSYDAFKLSEFQSRSKDLSLMSNH